MVEACAARGVLLTFNHQRRFGAPFRRAKELLDRGAIGALERVETFAPNLYDWGTHWLDMMLFYNDQQPVEWVLGQIDARRGTRIFGVPVEGQGMSLFRWTNGVVGMLATTARGLIGPTAAFRCANRLIGSEGTVEVGVADGPLLRLRNPETGGQWREIPVDGGMHGPELIEAAVRDLVEALDAGREPELSARKALQATELIFATYESSRRRARVDLPLSPGVGSYREMRDRGDLMEWEQADVRANGIRLHLYRSGGDLPKLVLCHGFSDNGLCWSRVARELAAEYDVIMVDARGHGLSEAAEEGYGDAGRAADLAGLIRALGLQRPAVVGHSMGAATAAVAAANYPDLIGAVVLEDPPWREEPADPGPWLAQRRVELEDRRSRSRAWLIDRCREANPGWDAAELGPWARAKQQLSMKIVTGGRSSSPPWREIVAGVSCPALLITASVERGAIITPALAQEAASINTRFQLLSLPDAGHNIRREAFEPYLRAVRAFLAADHGPAAAS